MLPKTETIKSHNSREQKPSNLNPTCKEMISDFAELCETAVCFFTYQTFWNKCRTSKKAQRSSKSGFRIFKISREVRVLKQSNLHCLAIVPTWQYCLYSHVWWIYDINRFRRLSQALVHFVIDRANLFTDHRTSIFQFMSNVNISENLKVYLWQFSNRFHFFFFEVMGHRCKE